MKRIHPEGWWTIAISAFIVIDLLVLSIFLFYDGLTWPLIGTLVLGIPFLVLIVNFFRNPHRVIVVNDKHVLAPCDGKVVVIEKIEENLYLNEPRKQISIFMSPLNVHVNRTPIAGVVKYHKYTDGKYLLAWNPKSSTDNEQTYIVIQNPNTGVRIGFKQIAGFLARRIKCYIKEGDVVEQGQPFGFIKLGSRMDVFIPLDAKVVVSLNDKVVGGKTVLAILP